MAYLNAEVTAETFADVLMHVFVIDDAHLCLRCDSSSRRFRKHRLTIRVREYAPRKAKRKTEKENTREYAPYRACCDAFLVHSGRDRNDMRERECVMRVAVSQQAR